MLELPLAIINEEQLSLPPQESPEDIQESYSPLGDLIRTELLDHTSWEADYGDPARLRATLHLLHDLAKRGWSGLLVQNGGTRVTLKLKSPNSAHSKQEIREVMAPRRLELLRQSTDWIKRVEPSIVKRLADGVHVSPSCISPEIEECTTQNQRDIFRYARYLSSVPYSEYVGRRMHFLIRDGGLPDRPLIGIAAIGSSLLQIAARDNWIGWNTKDLREVKKRRIANLMDLYVAVAVPPYSFLLGGKLICYMMASNWTRQAFEDKYRERKTLAKKRVVKDLVLLATTSIYGRHSSQYNRIKYKDRLLYIPVGETKGLGTLHIGGDTFDALRDALANDGAELGYEFGEGANWRLRVVREGMDRLGFDSDQCLKHGHSRGVYIVPLARNARDFLCGRTNRIDYFDYPLDEMIDYWRKRWLEMRAENSQVMKRVRAFKADSLRLTRLLDS